MTTPIVFTKTDINSIIKSIYSGIYSTLENGKSINGVKNKKFHDDISNKTESYYKMYEYFIKKISYKFIIDKIILNENCINEIIDTCIDQHNKEQALQFSENNKKYLEQYDLKHSLYFEYFALTPQDQERILDSIIKEEGDTLSNSINEYLNTYENNIKNVIIEKELQIYLNEIQERKSKGLEDFSRLNEDEINAVNALNALETQSSNGTHEENALFE